MRPEILHTILVRDVGAALPTLYQVDMVQHHVSRKECRRYIALTDRQWWALVQWVSDREREQVAACSDRQDGKTEDGQN